MLHLHARRRLGQGAGGRRILGALDDDMLEQIAETGFHRALEAG